MLYWITLILIIFSFLASLLPLVPSSYWLFRFFDYPRVQIMVIQLFTLFLLLLKPALTWWEMTGFVVILGNVLYLAAQVYPYTHFAAQQLKDHTPEEAAILKLSLLIWNVWQFNEQSDPFLTKVEDLQPDLILVCETNEWWVEALANLDNSYSYQVKVPLDNTYGMCLFSKFPLEDVAVEYIIREGVPSIHATVYPEPNHPIKIHGLHPIPPGPQFSAHTDPRDAELLIVGERVKEQELPTLVFGDMNDVAWSHMSRLFQKTSGLLDPRIGRSILPTFHARLPLLRVPLDHIFCSPEFRLIQLQRLPACGSDHFPVFASFALTKKAVMMNTLKLAETEAIEVENRIQAGLAY